ncbi:MAG TPA: Omp28-related outer membrane protein [Bacteroidia bacterium]|nr:Omp28-related outer membrane protein [Bacteroidia bacterium]
MKNKLFLLALLSIAFASCQKEENTNVSSATGDGSSIRQANPTSTGIGSTPATFTQKVLLENFTGAPYAKVPENDYMISQLQIQYPNRIIAASFHKNDRMEALATSNLLNFVSTGTTPNMPAVMLNRIVFNNKLINDQQTWSVNVPYALTGSPNIGLAIQSTVHNNILDMNIHVGFNAAVTGNYKMCVYLMENAVQHSGSGYNQANGFNTTISSPFYNMGNPIVNYTHNNVMRMQPTSITGITVPSTYQVTGGHMIQPLTMDIPSSLNFNNTYLIAFVYNTSNLMVMNSQIAKIGTVKTWD